MLQDLSENKSVVYETCNKNFAVISLKELCVLTDIKLIALRRECYNWLAQSTAKCSCDRLLTCKLNAKKTKVVLLV